jgi:hypothetical protein
MDVPRSSTTSWPGVGRLNRELAMPLKPEPYLAPALAVLRCVCYY